MRIRFAIAVLGLSASIVTAQSPTYDVILRHGVILDGASAAYRGDVGIVGNSIARIGDLSVSHAKLELDVRGLFVAPGFINIHSHAETEALPTAVNMLTQGVTTEIVNADGGGSPHVADQLRQMSAAGLAVNIAGYVGFNSVWASVMGMTNHRPTPDEIGRMQASITENLVAGAFGVSAGLDYSPGSFATTKEAMAVVQPAGPWRTNYPNHDRLNRDNGYSSRAGMAETFEIAEGAGLIPVFTHMKLQGHEQHTSDAVLGWMREQTAQGHYVAADVYPYLAGQTSLAAFFVPGWALDGGRAKMVERLHDPELRAKIIAEAEMALAARFGGPENVLLPDGKGTLADAMKQMQVTSPGEAVVRVLEAGSPTVILRFGAEDDLVKLLQYPAAAVACDCGASLTGRGHPRAFGTFPRVLGHYVRETHALTWENAVRKMTALPASIIGLVDRGYLAPGMAADVTVFDSAAVIDHATFDDPMKPSDGIRYVLVNGQLALRDGQPTGVRGGEVLTRSGHMPSRPMSATSSRRVAVSGDIGVLAADALVSGSQTTDSIGARTIRLDVSQRPGDHAARGTFQLQDRRGRVVAESRQLGVLQTADGWASLGGRIRLKAGGAERSFVVIVERADPLVPGKPATLTVSIPGYAPVVGTLMPERVTISTKE